MLIAIEIIDKRSPDILMKRPDIYEALCFHNQILFCVIIFLVE